MLVLAIILGGLMIYFLTPMRNEIHKDFVQSASKSFTVAMKNSFILTTFHKKAVFALLLFLITILVIWWSHIQTELYNVAHGIQPKIIPTNQAVSYIIGFTFYVFTIYLLLIIRRTIKLLRL
ncbi:hypothetical protein [Bacillus alkalisoli]|uniref:hypothetical protein n=1 Tax=Bacillus alkalisoli TaxID=2011008 RepID=UPI000C23C1C9|nr:hypothetical protein [Bacillus alkalisoli]